MKEDSSIPAFLVSPGPLARFIFALALSIAAVFAPNSMFIFSILLVILLAVYAWKGAVNGVLRLIVMALPLAVFILLLHLFTQSGERLFSIWVLGASLEGAKDGLRYGLKLFVFIGAGYIIFAAVDPFGLLRPFERIAHNLGSAGRTVSAIATAFYLSLRFLPELTVQGERTILALRSRGLDFKGNMVQKLRSMLFVLVPLFVSGLKRADLAAQALSFKGYGLRYRKAVLPPIRINIGSLVLLLLSSIILIAGIQIK